MTALVRSESAVPEFRLPPAFAGMRIGLLGGSFNPAHAGHLHISRIALARAGLDRIWWLVTPGNPLKDRSELAELSDRIAGAKAVADDPRIVVTALEAVIGTRFTADTIGFLVRRYPDVRFVWIMGADNMLGFHRWDRWRRIAGSVPMLVIDRPGAAFAGLRAPAAAVLQAQRLDESDAKLIADLEPPVWTLVHAPRSPLSSTAIRQGAA